MFESMFFTLYVLSYCVLLIVYREELREDWERWRRYRKELRRKGISKEEKEQITVLYWLNSGKF